ncbi:hypothetical protein ACWDPV_23730 [Gordonia sp. NPDC003504]
MNHINTQITDAAQRLYRAGVFGKPTAATALGASDYAREHWSMEDADHYRLGYPDYPDRPAMVYLVEAARQLCAQRHENAATCLELALAEIRRKAER